MSDPLLNIIEQHIRQHDSSFQLRRAVPVGGGSISRAFRFEGQGGNYFVKLNRAEHGGMFAAEALGLHELDRAGCVRVPRPLCHGVHGSNAFLVCDWLQLASAGSRTAAELGTQLAAMHRMSSSDSVRPYGWQHDNTIGSTPQPNTPAEDWCDFWREHRLGYQLQLAEGNGASSSLLQRGWLLNEKLKGLLGVYRPASSLLHGDLWGGNWGAVSSGEPVLFDPAVYYGDREADIAMTELFGGFPEAFYAAYRENWPLDAGYAMRRTLYNLYHVLNHFNLFGGGYASQAGDMIDRLLAEAG